MKSIVNAEEFYTALKKAFPACAKKSRISDTLNAELAFQGNICTVTCTDLNHWCQVTIPANGDNFSFRLENTKRTLSICGHYSGNLTVEYTEEAPPVDSESSIWLNALSLRSEGKACTQRVVRADPTLGIPEFDAFHTYQVNADTLLRRYKRIKYALSTSAARPVNQCIQFRDSRIFAVDGYRLAVSHDPALQVESVFSIPPGAMELLPVLGNTPCSLLVGEKYVAFETGDIRIVSRIPSGEGLNIDAAIPKGSQEEHELDIDTLIHDLQYLGEFITTPESQAVRLAGNSMSLSTSVGKCSVTLDLREPLKTYCGFNVQYMLESLKQFKAKKMRTVTMGLSSPFAPILLTDGDGDLAMILPMRLGNAPNVA